MGKISKIKVNNVDYDIEATTIKDQAALNVKSTAAATNATINFEVPSTKSEAVSGKVSGVLELNTKGNLALESKNKHVNIEAAKGIQMKPTTNMIIDTSRRVAAGDGNEAHIEVRWDDIPSGSTEDEYGKFIVEARAHDIRCYEHGGIALQPCGKDSSNFENKIKFESSRTNDIGSATPSYGEEGGKGLEFGTFNNEHTSIFTRDYRFKKDAKVYCVNRGTLVTESSKTDYPTQGDDFKDIPVDNLGVGCTYNNSTHEWEVSSTSIGATYIQGATWEEIIKSAQIATALTSITLAVSSGAAQLSASVKNCSSDPIVDVSYKLSSTATWTSVGTPSITWAQANDVRTCTSQTIIPSLTTGTYQVKLDFYKDGVFVTSRIQNITVS